MYKGINFNLIYVHGFTDEEIAFTKQKIVPVLKIDDDWLQDSRENCIWLDELYPDRPFAGENEAEREAIVAADQWVNENVIALHFRTLVDTKDRKARKRNCQRMADTIFPTFSGSWPWPWLKLVLKRIHHHLIPRVGYVKHIVSRLDADKDIQTLHDEIVREFERRIEKSGFLAETDHPSFADVSAFAQISYLSTYKFEGSLNITSSPRIAAWYEVMLTYFPKQPTPDLYQPWPPVGFPLRQGSRHSHAR